MRRGDHCRRLGILGAVFHRVKDNLSIKITAAQPARSIHFDLSHILSIHSQPKRLGQSLERRELRTGLGKHTQGEGTSFLTLAEIWPHNFTPEILT